MTLTDTTAVQAILAQPEAFVGKEVRVEGKVKEVCEMAGCWMELEAGDGDQTLKVKVKDGDIVFPVAARGKQAVAQGKVEDLEMTRAKYVKYLEHAAEEQGGKFDEATPSRATVRSTSTRSPAPARRSASRAERWPAPQGGA